MAKQLIPAKPNSRFVRWMKRKLGGSERPVVRGFRGYGNGNKAWIIGRVMEDLELTAPSPDLPGKVNVKETFRRFFRGGYSRVKVKVRFLGEEFTLKTNATGTFMEEVELKEAPAASGQWHTFEAELLDKVIEGQREEVKGSGEVYFPPENPDFGIISDFDDTVILSDSHLPMGRMTTLAKNNASTRIALEGMPELYQKLVKEERNPLFFVSSSEWNLYDLIEDFTGLNNFPRSPFLLKSVRVGIKDAFQSDNVRHLHKQRRVQAIMDFYPDLKFMLFGDSGQADAAIYREIIEANPGRILAAYIRDVGIPKKREGVEGIIATLKSHHPSMLIVKNGQEAEKHAREWGWV